jgi:hypothetical protein
MDLSQFALDGLVVVAVFIIISLVVKPILEIWMPPTATAHDPVIRGLAVLIGVVGILLDHGFPASTDGHSWILLIIGGILSGLSAIGAFHTITGSATPANAVTVIPPTPLPETAVARALQPSAPTEHVVTLKLTGAAGQTITAEPLPAAKVLEEPPAIPPKSESPTS